MTLAPQLSAELEPRLGETLDSICAGDIQLLQSANGYRFNLDPILLAHFANDVRPPDGPCLELGTGCGVVSIVLARKFSFTDLTALEVQPSLHELALRNVERNGCEGRVRALQVDLRHAAGHLEPGHFSHVISNPPYRPLSAGRINPQPEKAIARFEVQCTLQDIAKTASVMLRLGGAFSWIYPAARVVDALATARAFKLEPKVLRFIHPRKSAPAKLVLLSATKGGRPELTTQPPLYVHEGEGFTEEVRRMVG